MTTNGISMNGSVLNAVAEQAEADKKLTKREVEVLTLVIEGKSSKEVADQLYVSKRTVDFHLANIYHKLQVNNRVQAFREATRRGLISVSMVG
jgi:DNA-binding NarL/FixJ family response regulator